MWRGGVSGTGVVVLLVVVVVGGCVVRWVELLLAAGQRCCGPNGGGGGGIDAHTGDLFFLSYRLRQHGVMRLMHCLIGSQPVRVNAAQTADAVDHTPSCDRHARLLRGRW